jgi:hypothetical protein
VRTPQEHRHAAARHLDDARRALLRAARELDAGCVTRAHVKALTGLALLDDVRDALVAAEHEEWRPEALRPVH